MDGVATKAHAIKRFSILFISTVHIGVVRAKGNLFVGTWARKRSIILASQYIVYNYELYVFRIIARLASNQEVQWVHHLFHIPGLHLANGNGTLLLGYLINGFALFLLLTELCLEFHKTDFRKQCTKTQIRNHKRGIRSGFDHCFFIYSSYSVCIKYRNFCNGLTKYTSLPGNRSVHFAKLVSNRGWAALYSFCDNEKITLHARSFSAYVYVIQGKKAHCRTVGLIFQKPNYYQQVPYFH